MAFNIPLTKRVEINYRHTVNGSPSPAEAMQAIWPEMYGSGLQGLPNIPMSSPSFDLGIGIYLKTDPAILQAVANGIQSTGGNYFSLPEAGELVARKYADEHGVSLDPGTQISLTCGARSAIMLALLRYLEPGDRVVVPDPDYISFPHLAAGLGAEVVRVPMKRGDEGDLSVDVDRMVATIRTGCRLVMISNPNNPVGLVWTREDLTAVADAVASVGGLLLVNEVYDKMIFDGYQHHTVLSVGDPQHTVAISGTSKSYSLGGLPFGWIAGSPDFIKPLADVSFIYQIPKPSAASLYAGAAALSEPVRSSFPRNYVNIMQKNAEATRRVFEQMPGVLFPKVQGSQFAFPWIGEDDISFCRWVKQTASITIMPGVAWGDMGRGHIRLALANPSDYQEQALDLLGAILKTRGSARSS